MRALKQIRLPHYDYKKNGYYFVTMCTNYRKALLIGKTKDVVAQFIEQLPVKIKGLQVDYYSIVPTHVHIILILENCDLKVGEIIRRLKALITKYAALKLWQPNYYEHVIRNENALRDIRQYIINNPEKERLNFEELSAQYPFGVQVNWATTATRYRWPNKLGNYTT